MRINGEEQIEKNKWEKVKIYLSFGEKILFRLFEFFQNVFQNVF
jgi:hypothetical protein